MYGTQRGPDLQFKINLPFGGCMSRGPIELKESFNLINLLGIFSRCLEFLGQVHSYALIRGISGSLARLEDGRWKGWLNVYNRAGFFFKKKSLLVPVSHVASSQWPSTVSWSSLFHTNSLYILTPVQHFLQSDFYVELASKSVPHIRFGFLTFFKFIGSACHKNYSTRGHMYSWAGEHWPHSSCSYPGSAVN